MTLELLLDDRQPDKVVVSVCLAPEGEPHALDGVAVELFDPTGQSLGPRLLLPISGTLGGPLVTQAELKRDDPIPRYSRIVATAWWGTEQIQATCPADRGTDLCNHIRPTCPVNPHRRAFLENLLEEEREALTRAFPWLDSMPLDVGRPDIPFSLVATAPLDSSGPVSSADADPVRDTLDEITDELGLDDENAAWLRELLAEDDQPG